MKYIIHRGITSDKIKENSYIAIKNALLDKESSGVEFDIRLTKDNKIVLSHNSIINSNHIENMTYNEIIKLKYLITLDKILSINTNKILLIDIKVNNNYKKFGDILINELNNTTKNIYLASFNKKIIKYIRKKTKLKCGYIVYKYIPNKNNFILINYKKNSNKKFNKIKDKEIFLWTIKSKKELNNIINKIANIKKYYIIIDKKN